MREFLATCSRVTDKELFGIQDYWQPPDEFEKLKKGDCEDFALWTWRQLLSLGYDARFVGGSHGRYGIGHAWVTYFMNGKCCVVEPTAAGFAGHFIPRLSTLNYHPRLSVSWDGERLSYYSHKDRESSLGLKVLIPLVPDWLVFWAWTWLRAIPRLPFVFAHRPWRKIGKEKIDKSKRLASIRPK